MNKLDCRILQLLQDDFPLCQKPYDRMARRLQISADELFDRVETLISKGLIRRIGASLDSRKLGFSSTLAAVSVGAEHISRAAEIICRFPEVTHCYLRSDRFNIWFTIITADNDRIEKILEQIRLALSLQLSELLNLPMKRLFKLDARFNLSA
jgi:DNA-binding Lrp family transcriptional regulator